MTKRIKLEEVLFGSQQSYRYNSIIALKEVCQPPLLLPSKDLLPNKQQKQEFFHLYMAKFIAALPTPNSK
ncbi:hypothetical protein ACMA1I_01180 [Pontibacter sp. 13R65]|uniref:hypothetical protein n=1 Tax=Pontibacter sp. 13R65 TaxID=3127458 RepID=UPI00301CB6B9